jgi:hypothetical protein
LRIPLCCRDPLLNAYLAAALADQDLRPAKKKKARKQRGTRTKATAPARTIEYIRVPKHWFSEPLHHHMKTAVRPPTARTRRKELSIEMKMPFEIFTDLLKPLKTNDMANFEWLNEEKTDLKPTKDAKTFWEYDYKCTKPALMDQIWRMESHEKVAVKTGKDGTQTGMRRGHGAARLHLSAAAAARGERSDLLSQVTGHTRLRLKVPKAERAMPTFKLDLKVSTMDKNGHIIWAALFDANTQAGLRKQMRAHLEHMISNPEYPTLSTMAPALTMASQEVRPQPAPRAPQPAMVQGA